LNKTGNDWKQFSGTVTVTEGNGNLELNFQNHTSMPVTLFTCVMSW
jgi:hypothetical protein